MDFLPMHAWHPMLVHFPLGLLLGGVAVESAGWLIRRPVLQRIGLVLLTAGVLVAVPTVASGLIAYDQVDHSDVAHALMKLHRNLMLVAVSLFAIAVLWRWRAGGGVVASSATAVLYGVLLGVATAALVVGADRGAALVFGHATGLSSERLDEIIRERRDQHGHDPSDADSTLDRKPTTTRRDSLPIPTEEIPHEHRSTSQ